VESEYQDREARCRYGEQAMTESNHAHEYLLSRPPVVGITRLGGLQPKLRAPPYQSKEIRRKITVSPLDRANSSVAPLSDAGAHAALIMLHCTLRIEH
jgi:hypothetical protein